MKKLFAKIKKFAGKCWRKFKKLCKFVVDEIKNAAQWCMDNQEVVYVISGITTIAYSIVKKIRKNAVLKEQEFHRTHIFDRSLNHWWSLKRDLTTNEMLEYEHRRATGETIGEILESMKVLA